MTAIFAHNILCSYDRWKETIYQRTMYFTYVAYNTQTRILFESVPIISNYISNFYSTRINRNCTLNSLHSYFDAQKRIIKQSNLCGSYWVVRYPFIAVLYVRSQYEKFWLVWISMSIDNVAYRLKDTKVFRLIDTTVYILNIKFEDN